MAPEWEHRYQGTLYVRGDASGLDARLAILTILIEYVLWCHQVTVQHSCQVSEEIQQVNRKR